MKLKFTLRNTNIAQLPDSLAHPKNTHLTYGWLRFFKYTLKPETCTLFRISKYELVLHQYNVVGVLG